MNAIKNKSVWQLVGYFLGVTLLIGLGFKVFHHLELFKDIISFDEGKYMYFGMKLSEGKFIKSWGPLYGIWYFCLSFIQSDFVKLYFLNFKILALLGPILLFILLRLKNTDILAAFLLSAGFLISNINMGTWPHISHFCVVLILFTLIVSHFFSLAIRWMLAITAFFFISYARPEIFLAFMIMAALFAIWLIFKRFRLKPKEWIAIVLLGGLILGIQMKIGNTMFSKSANVNFEKEELSRPTVAFRQHWAVNYFEWEGMGKSNWKDFEQHFLEHFDPSPSFFETITSNKPMFWKHFFFNASNYMYRITDYISGIIIPEKVFNFPYWLRLILSILILAALCFFRWTHIKATAQKMVQGKEYLTFLTLILFAGTTVLTSLLIYPRHHYILMQIPFFLLVIGYFLFSESEENSIDQKGLLALVVLGGLFILLGPTAKKFEYYDVWEYRNNTRNSKAIAALKSLDLGEHCSATKPCAILDYDGFISVYVEETSLQSVMPYQIEGWETIEAYLTDINAKAIYMTATMKTNPYLAKINGWSEFIANPASLGYSKLPLDGLEDYLLIREL